MKNGLLKSFLTTFVVANIAFYYGIESAFIIVSEFMWAIFDCDIMAIVLASLFVVLFLIFLIYLFKHKDKKDLVETVEFEAPKGMTPVEVGYLVDGVVDNSDLSALLVYWASKKYIEISKETENQKLKKLVEKLPDNTKNFEKQIFNQIFGSDKEVFVSQVEQRFESVPHLVNSIVKEVQTSVGDKYFDKKILWYRQVFIILFAFLFYISAMYFRLEYYIDLVPIVEIFVIVATALFVLIADWVLRYFDYRHKNNMSKGRTISIIIFVLYLVVLVGLCAYFFWTDLYLVGILIGMAWILFAVVMLSRKLQIYKKEGQGQLGKILGFKNFIEVAEKDRIKMLVEQNPNIFYEVLPYAFVLGVSDKWIRNLEVLEIEYPQISTENAQLIVIGYAHLMRSSNFRILRAARIATAVRLASTGKISLGSNRRSGGSKGGSNFGGIRRR